MESWRPRFRGANYVAATKQQMESASRVLVTALVENADIVGIAPSESMPPERQSMRRDHSIESPVDTYLDC